MEYRNITVIEHFRLWPSPLMWGRGGGEGLRNWKEKKKKISSSSSWLIKFLNKNLCCYQIKNLVYWFRTNPRIMKYISTTFRFQVQFKFSTGSNLYHFQAWAVPSAFKLTTAKVKFNFISSLCCQDPVLQPCTVSSQNIVIYDPIKEKVIYIPHSLFPN